MPVQVAGQLLAQAFIAFRMVGRDDGVLELLDGCGKFRP
jgi:hypothetical protein